MKIEAGNIFDHKYGIIAHQVNCQLKMGSGIAMAVRTKYPRAYIQYRDMFKNVPPGNRLGRAHVVEVIKDNLYIANLFGQFNFLPRGSCHTDYNALTVAIRQLRQWRDNIKGVHFPVYFPYGIGCGLAGGDWNIVSGIIEDVIPDATIVRLSTKVVK